MQVPAEILSFPASLINLNIFMTILLTGNKIYLIPGNYVISVCL